MLSTVIIAAASFLFACVSYFFMMLDFFHLGCCDPDGGLFRYLNRGTFGQLELGLFTFNFFLLGIWLGCLLIPPVMRRSTSGHAARWEAFGAFILFPLSLFSTVFAFDLYERYHGLALAVPIFVPPLIGLYGIWARFPHAMHRADVTSAFVCGAILVLTIAPFRWLIWMPGPTLSDCLSGPGPPTCGG
jgi:hypothetical protein